MKKLTDTQANLIGFILASIIISPLAINVLGGGHHTKTDIQNSKVQKLIEQGTNIFTPNKKADKATKDGYKQQKIDNENKKALDNNTQSLGMTANEFKTNYNSVAAENNESKIKGLSVYQGKTKNSFSYEFTSNDTLVGTINKNTNKLKSITLISSSLTKKDLKITKNTIKTLVKASNPDITEDEANTILNELITTDFNTKDYNQTVNYKNLKYTLTSMENAGITFSVSSISNN